LTGVSRVSLIADDATTRRDEEKGTT